jgi:predicted amidophosphoribosyltransferase
VPLGPTAVLADVRAWLADAWTALADLVLPGMCAGCGAHAGTAVCRDCAAAVSAAVPGPVAPSPAPPGMPACVALGPYEGVLRELILGYKERGRHDLARPLGGLLGAAVAAGSSPVRPLALVPVPATAATARRRYGDHMARLAAHAARALRRAGWTVAVHRPLRALPRPDSATLDAAARSRAAEGAFVVRAASPLRRAVFCGARVVVVDDIVTTGVTLATVARRLAGAGAEAGAAAVLAATRRRVVCPDPNVLRSLGETGGDTLRNEG